MGASHDLADDKGQEKWKEKAASSPFDKNAKSYVGQRSDLKMVWLISYALHPRIGGEQGPRFADFQDSREKAAIIVGRLQGKMPLRN